MDAIGRLDIFDYGGLEGVSGYGGECSSGSAREFRLEYPAHVSFVIPTLGGGDKDAEYKPTCPIPRDTETDSLSELSSDGVSSDCSDTASDCTACPSPSPSVVSARSLASPDIPPAPPSHRRLVAVEAYGRRFLAYDTRPPDSNVPKSKLVPELTCGGVEVPDYLVQAGFVPPPQPQTVCLRDLELVKGPGPVEWDDVDTSFGGSARACPADEDEDAQAGRRSAGPSRPRDSFPRPSGSRKRTGATVDPSPVHPKKKRQSRVDPVELVCRVSACTRTFKTVADCHRHRRTHFAEAYQWACAGCTTLFGRPDALKRHILSREGCLKASGPRETWGPNLGKFRDDWSEPWEGELTPTEEMP